MFTVETEVFINRPQQEVFDFVADPDNSPKWQSQILSSEWASEGPPAVGSINRSVSRFLGREIHTMSEITIWDPPHQSGFKVSEGPFPLEATATYETKGNGTQITLQVAGDTRGFFKLAEGLVSKQLQKQLETNYSALKLLLESGTG